MDGKAVQRSRKIARHAGHGAQGRIAAPSSAGAKRKTVIRSSKFETFPIHNNIIIIMIIIYYNIITIPWRIFAHARR